MTNSYLIADEASNKAVLFDAPDHTTEPLLREASRRGWNVIGLWLTHGHFDHFADHELVRTYAPEAKVLIHPLDEPKARHPEVQTRLFGLPIEIPALNPDGYLQASGALSMGGITVQVLHTPGHSPGHVAFYIASESVLVGGDLIIGGSVGRTDLPDSDPLEFERSLLRVMELPAETRLLPGHGEPSTLGEERRSNAFLHGILHNAKQNMPRH